MKRPNILFILSDDQGYWAMGCAGNSEIKTPNLDRLASEGILFENFFCVSPVCSPARASIVTGRIPSYHGVHDWIARGCIDNPGEFGRYVKKDIAIDYLKGIPTYPQILAENGYNCALSGKWHLGDHEHSKPGFERWFCHGFGGGPYFNGPMLDKGKRIKAEGYITDVITERALIDMEEMAREDNPFYLSVHYTAPHSPWSREHHPASTWDEYHDNCPFESVPREKRHPWHNNPMGKNRKEALSGYFTAVTEMDRNIGLLMDKLEDLGIRDETLIVFTSDNGMNMGHHGIWGKGNGTFPLNMYETSVKVPCIISHRGAIPQGSRCSQVLSHYDIFPTLLDYTGTERPSLDKQPGVSFQSILEGEDKPVRDEVVVFDEYGPVRMIRTEDWKYVHRYPYGPHELYHLAEDSDERFNLLESAEKDEDSAEGRKLIELRDRLTGWFHHYGLRERDGRGEPVTGAGQRDLAGPDGHGRSFYSLNS